MSKRHVFIVLKTQCNKVYPVVKFLENFYYRGVVLILRWVLFSTITGKKIAYSPCSENEVFYYWGIKFTLLNSFSKHPF